MMKRSKLSGATSAAVALGLTVTAAHASESTTLTGVTDFQISTVFQSFFGGSDQSLVTTQNRWQVNGANPGFTLGIFGVFDLDGSQLQNPAGIASVDGIDGNLFPAVNQDSGSGGVQTGGDFQIWFTTQTFDIFQAGTEFIPGEDNTGLGNQFDPTFLMAETNLQSGIYDISLGLDVASAQNELVNAINSGETIRFLLTATTPDFAAQFGTGMEDPGAFFPFFGEAPTIDFQTTAIPAPGAVALLAVAGLFGRSRRRG